MEKELIRRIKRGDKKAFKMLYDLYADYGLRTAYSLTGNKFDSSDVVQETFIKVYNAIQSFDEARPFKPWFYRILINECRRFLKKRNREAKANEHLESSIYAAVIPGNPEEEFFDLYAAISSLADIYRVPVILKYLNGLSEKEIGEVLNINVSTVKSRLYKGRQKLKELLKEVVQ